jgi:hypothetical protein
MYFSCGSGTVLPGLRWISALTVAAQIMQNNAMRMVPL